MLSRCCSDVTFNSHDLLERSVQQQKILRCIIFPGYTWYVITSTSHLSASSSRKAV